MSSVPSTSTKPTAKPIDLLATLTRDEWFLIGLAVAVITMALFAVGKYPVVSWGDIADPLFAFASSLLFMVAILIQLRGHRQAIAEMEQANTNHAAMLLVAKQEKEFNVVTAAIAEARAHVDGIEHAGSTRHAAMHVLTNDWQNRLFDPKDTEGTLLSGYGLRTYDRVGVLFEHYRSIKEVLVKLRWLNSVLAAKSLDDRDREYLAVRIQNLTRETVIALWGIRRIRIMLEKALSKEANAGLIQEHHNLIVDCTACIAELDALLSELQP